MANTKISALPANTSPSWTEEFVYADNSANGKITLNTVKTFVQPDLSSYATTAQLAQKQDELVSWLNIKTINGNSIIWSWNLNTETTYSEYDYSAIQWPASAWYHIPLPEEWQAVYDIWTALWWWVSDWTNFWASLKLPLAWYVDVLPVTIYNQWTNAYYWAAKGSASWCAYQFYFRNNSINPQLWTAYRSYGASIRCFKNVSVTPDLTWTKLYWTSIEEWWIFWDSVSWLISLSSDWQTWITIADKNLWATTVWNSWDGVSAANCWNYYQWWNNYWFSWSWWYTESWTRVNTTWYWPWNYYSSSTFINPHYADWSNPSNDNLWWWETWIVITEYDIYNKLQLEWTDITIWWNFIWWIAWSTLSWSYTLITWDNQYIWHEHYLYIPTQTNSYSLTLWTWVTNPFNLTLPSSITKACLIKFYCDSQSTMIISDCKIAS